MPDRVKIVFNLAGRRAGKLRREILEGRTHLVVPTVMLVEGVMEGSGGPLFYPNEENGKDPESWNHMPVVVYHPKRNGDFISAKQPDVLNTSKVGLLLNTQHDGKLKTEAWFDEERTKEVDERVYNAIVNEEPMEVSTGLYSEVEWAEGEYNGKKYKGIARNHRPDHLAVLPDQKGACSVADGAGLYANSAVEKVAEKDEEFLAVEKIKNAKSEQVQAGAGKEYILKRPKVAIFGNLLVNGMSLSDIQSAVCQALYAKYSKPGYSWNGWISDVFDGFVVYYADGKLWKMDYSNKDGKIEIQGDPVEVVRSVEYKTVTNEVIGNSSNWQFEPIPQKERKMDKSALIKNLIGNGWDESERPWLEAQDEKVLKKLQPAAKPPETPPTPTPAAPVVNTAPVQGTVITPEQAKMFQKLIANENNRKVQLAKQIIAGQESRGVPVERRFTEAFLANKEIDELEAWAATVAAPAQDDGDGGMFQRGGNGAPLYFGGGGGPIANQDVFNEDPPVMPELDFSNNGTTKK